MRKVITILLALCTAVVGLISAPVAAIAAPDSTCNIRWGSQDKSAGVAVPEEEWREVTNVRTGRHQCFDRMVADVSDATDVYAYYSSNSGVRGGAALSVIVGAVAYDVDGRPATYRPENPRELTNVAHYQTFRQAALAFGDDGATVIDLGVRARLPFRVFTLDDRRLVVDVAHHW